MCSAECASCIGSQSNCSSCTNVTTVVAGTSKTTIYYKDAVLNTCATSCRSQQFIDSTVPNTCSKCDKSCNSCTSSSSNCQSCVSGYYLYSADSQCLTSCPTSFYNNPVLDTLTSSYICSPCASECKVCYGSTASKCNSCSNITNTQGTVSIFFKQPTTDTCASTCPTGYLAT